MRHNLASLIIAAVVTALPMSSIAGSAENQGGNQLRHRGKSMSVQVGPRPYYLVEDMDPSPLKDRLQQCSEKPFRKTDFSIGHRGAGLQFPEHTQESYEAAAHGRGHHREGTGLPPCAE